MCATDAPARHGQLVASGLNSPGRAVVIAASPSVNYGRVMEVMDLLQRADIEKIGLLTRPRAN